MTKSCVVGLTGIAGSGKSTIAQELVAQAGFVRVRFGVFLKSMLRGFYTECGLSELEIERRIEGDLKEVPDPLLCGKTPRYAMQTLGTEWGREKIDPDLWLNAWSARADKEISAGNDIVVDDLRFPNEAKAVSERGGVVVKLIGRGIGVGDHPSEQPLASDCVVSNTGSVEITVNEVLNALPDFI